MIPFSELERFGACAPPGRRPAPERAPVEKTARCSGLNAGWENLFVCSCQGVTVRYLVWSRQLVRCWHLHQRWSCALGGWWAVDPTICGIACLMVTVIAALKVPLQNQHAPVPASAFLFSTYTPPPSAHHAVLRRRPAGHQHHPDTCCEFLSVHGAKLLSASSVDVNIAGLAPPSQISAPHRSCELAASAQRAIADSSGV